MNVDQLLNGKGNLKGTYVSCLEDHKVVIENQPFYLIKTFYGTNTKLDFLSTFSNQLDDNLLEKANIIPEEIAYNEYAVIYDMSLKVVAVFNKKFAYYDFKQHKIIFREPEDILLTFYKENLNPPKKSVEEQIKDRLEICHEKVNDKISLVNEQKPLPSPVFPEPPNYLKPPRPPGPPEPKQDDVMDELQEKLRKINPSFETKRKKRKDRSDSWMDHAIMYAAAPPIKK